MSNKWMDYWPCNGDTRQASLSVFPKAWCWTEARPLFQWWNVSKSACTCSKEVAHLRMLPAACFHSMSEPEQNILCPVPSLLLTPTDFHGNRWSLVCYLQLFMKIKIKVKIKGVSPHRSWTNPKVSVKSCLMSRKTSGPEINPPKFAQWILVLALSKNERKGSSTSS